MKMAKQDERGLRLLFRDCAFESLDGLQCPLKPEKTTSEAEPIILVDLAEGDQILKTHFIHERFGRIQDRVFRCSNRTGLCGCADFAVIGRRNNRNFILHIEIKNSPVNDDPNNSARGKIVKQLRGSHAFISYCGIMLENFFEGDGALENARERYVGICRPSIPKRRTRIKTKKLPRRKAGPHSGPDNFLRANVVGTISINRLLGDTN